MQGLEQASQSGQLSRLAVKFDANNARISGFLTAFSILVWTVSIVQARDSAIGDYGLFSTLPWTFYAAFYILLGAIYLNVMRPNGARQSPWLLVAQGFLVACFLLATPSFVEGTARVSHSWLKYGYTDYIVRHGHTSLSIWYHNWPAPFIFSAQLVEVSSMSPVTFPLVFPLVLDAIIFVIILMLFRAFFPEDRRKAIIGLAFFYLISSQNQFYYAPQIFGFLAFLLLVYIIHFQFMKFEIRALAILAALFVFLVLTHLLTAIIAGLYLGLSILVDLYLGKGSEFVKKNKRRILGIVTVCACVVAAWFLFARAWVGEINWQFDPALVFNLAAAYFEKLGQGSTAHAVLVLVRMVFAIAVAVLVLAIARKGLLKGASRSMFLLLVAGVVPVFFFGYGIEIVQRAFLFCALPMAVLVAVNFEGKKMVSIFTAFAIVAVPVFVLSAYGNEKVDYTSQAEIDGAYFLIDNAQQGVVVGGSSVAQSVYLERYSWVDASAVNATTGNTTGLYIVFTTSDTNFAVWYLGDSRYLAKESNLIHEGNFDKIYSSQDFTLYKRV